MKFGCHVSIKDGYLAAAKHAASIQASAFQYFPKNPRSLSVKNYDPEDTHYCKQFTKENKLVSVSHAPYPAVLTAAASGKRKQLVESILNDLEISEACGSLGVVVHFGKLLNANQPLESYKLIIDSLDEILRRWDGNAKILLENNAGNPGSFGTEIEELVKIRELLEFPEKLGFCLDTCHLFASGIWNGDNWNHILTKGTELGYFDHLNVIHLNNSKYESGRGKDRHSNILIDGFITRNQFTDIIESSQLAGLPFILETPEDIITHKEELRQLRETWR